MFAADALSRYPSAKPNEEDDDLADEYNMSAMQLSLLPMMFWQQQLKMSSKLL